MNVTLARLGGFEPDLLRVVPAPERVVAQVRGAILLTGAVVGGLAAALLVWRLTGSWVRSLTFGAWSGGMWLLLSGYTVAGYRARCPGCGALTGLHLTAALMRLLLVGLMGVMAGASLAAAIVGPVDADGRLLLGLGLDEVRASPGVLLGIVAPVLALAWAPMVHVSLGAPGTATYEQLRAQRDGELIRRHDARLEAVLPWPLARRGPCGHEWRHVPADAATSLDR